MAIHFHGTGVPLLCQTRATGSSGFQTSAVVPLIRRLASPKGTFKLHCSVVSNRSISSNQTEPPSLLSSLAVPGLPPCQESPHADAAEAYLRERFPFNWTELEHIFHASISFMSFCHPATVTHDRLAAISAVCVHAIILDDVLLDSQDAILAEKMGIDPTIVGNPGRIREYFLSLDVLLRQESEPLTDLTPIQEMTWKLGCDLRALSKPEWFTIFADSYLTFFLACLDHYEACLEGDSSPRVTDVESFTEMRLPTCGAGWNHLGIQLCSNVFLSTEICRHPVVEKLSNAAWVWGAYVNDIFSYAKEQDEPYAPNLIKALMDVEGLPVVEAGWRAVKLTNACTQEILHLETELWDQVEAGPGGSAALRRYVDGIKEAMTGNLYWHTVQKRYRHPKSPFPELRDLNIGFFPKTAHYKARATK